MKLGKMGGDGEKEIEEQEEKNPLSALVRELDIPREKRKAPLGSTKSASPVFSPVG